MKILNSKYDAKLKEIVQLHNITKHYIMLGEEIDNKFYTFLQPVKEFRDSYDHILRIFKSILFNEEKSDDEYISKQLSKALGHEYRAFFDVGDWLTIVCRDISIKSIKNSKNDVSDLKDDFNFIIDSNKKIAELRERKDIHKKIQDVVNDYQNIMTKLYESTVKIQKATLV